MADDNADHRFPPLKNDLLLRAARGEEIERVPVWVMRQAGRYLPEFRELRAEHNFFKICQTPELACQITLQPIERYPELDGSIIFCDILVIPQAMGMTVEMIPGKGPSFPSPLSSPDDMSRLQYPVDVKASLGYVMKAITLTRQRLDGRVPLFGFCGAPWTLMSYMIEGGGSTTHSKSKAWLYRHPAEAHQLLDMLANTCADFLVEQVRAGAQILQVFDSHAGILGSHLFSTFSLPYLEKIASKVKATLKEQAVPMVVFAKGAHYAIEKLAMTSYDVLGLDWSMDPQLARSQCGEKVLQGNLDPCALYTDQDDLRKKTEEMMLSFRGYKHIANLGHGIYPDMDPDHLRTFLRAVNSYRKS
uniref:Uroporphyrinogen decarboxylase n=1 Tax=Halisarca dujardinii TaxID=2583056 RepID=A0A6H1QTY8_HALDU|nr:uroporphyrinogen decarboxylase-like protein [Halisarca dujardinii]